MFENAKSLTTHGNRTARADLLEIAEQTLASLHPDEIVPNLLRREGTHLHVDGETYDLSTVDEVYVIGAGKGSTALVGAVLDQLGVEVSAGIVAEKAGQEGPLPGVTVVGAGHPIPDETSLEAGLKALEIADRAGPTDLVFACITGGASAQLVAPVPEVPLADLASTTEALLQAGLPIEEINAVRKQLSTIKGGQLTQAIAPARTIGLCIVDEVAGEVWGPTVGDTSTPAAAIGVLERARLWDGVSDSVREALRAGQRAGSSRTVRPESINSASVQHVAVADSGDLCDAARDAVAALGYTPLVLSSTMEGESRDVARAVASIAREVVSHDRPAEPPCVLVSGGETTVAVPDDAGDGGPNQEFALQFALDVAEEPRITTLALGTDGTDGPTNVAGGLVDHTTVTRIRASGEDPVEALRRHDSSTALQTSKDAVITGATATNLMDLRLVLVDTQPETQRTAKSDGGPERRQ